MSVDELVHIDLGKSQVPAELPQPVEPRLRIFSHGFILLAGQT
jgi:hypothetical protein